ncbi:MAG TPA: aspartate--tRNA ligase [Chitinivibrionales bacterium]|nr:aspartate--tRNA ligase [Chitinivibrionales bacterium]
MHDFRSHNCGELRKSDIGKQVRVAGWIHTRRDHGGVLFIDLRDNFGLTQVVVYPSAPFQDAVSRLPKETVVRFDGKVEFRSEENVNPKMPTGEVDVVAESYEVLGASDALPLNVFPEDEAPEDLRLKYRFLDLRRNKLHKNIILRSDVVASMRRRMWEMGFKEFQTPILTSSSPEGARDYLVPSRIHPGKFYALPQAPQQFKQLLMISGFDKYFQIAPCFRDEDARSDRSPGEFYQLDMEMSFVTQDDIFAVVEKLIHGVFSEFSSRKMDAPPFVRIPFRESMVKYGTDKPDLRIPIEMRDSTAIFAAAGFKVFAEAVKGGATVRAIPVKGIAKNPRNFFDKMVDYATSIGAKGLAYLQWLDANVKGPLMKFLTPDDLKKIEELCGVGTGDVVFFICDTPQLTNKICSDLRVKLGKDLGMIDPDSFRFCWIVDFPMYEWDEENKCVAFSHNPFSMPQGGMGALASKKPLDILAFQYDIVCNGIELSSGAIRNHQPEIMYKAFEIAGYSRDTVDERFGAMIAAFKLGAPPHGGIAPGVDRIVMLLADEQNIREVIAFPMNQRAQDLMMNAPAPATVKQLRELHIRVAGHAASEEKK